MIKCELHKVEAIEICEEQTLIAAGDITVYDNDVGFTILIGEKSNGTLMGCWVGTYAFIHLGESIWCSHEVSIE